MTAPALCVRRAWLDLYGDGSQTVQLDNPAGGYFCQSLDLGYPAPRDVMTSRPDQPGVDDRTAFAGSRVVQIDVTALVGAGARIDAVASQFAPYMLASARPVLHYILDRPGTAERTITLRPSGYSWPIVGANQRDIQLQFVAGDPWSSDPVVQTVIAWSGSSTIAGRTYPLTFNRIYPPGGSGAMFGTIRSHGDFPVQPKLRIYGPITSPIVGFNVSNQTSGPKPTVQFATGFIISAGQYVDVDTQRKTAYLMGDPTQPVIGQLNWINLAWPLLSVMPAYTNVTLGGTSTTGVTQVQVTWQDRFMS